MEDEDSKSEEHYYYKRREQSLKLGWIFTIANLNAASQHRYMRADAGAMIALSDTKNFSNPCRGFNNSTEEIVFGLDWYFVDEAL